jgi:hypothetical protein
LPSGAGFSFFSFYICETGTWLATKSHLVYEARGIVQGTEATADDGGLF